MQQFIDKYQQLQEKHAFSKTTIFSNLTLVFLGASNASPHTHTTTPSQQGAAAGAAAAAGPVSAAPGIEQECSSSSLPPPPPTNNIPKELQQPHVLSRFLRCRGGAHS